MHHFTLRLELFPPDAHRKLRLAHFAGLCATIVTGASVVPWIGALTGYAFSHLLFHPQSPLPFPNPLGFLLSPNWLTGVIWPLYHMVALVRFRVSVSSSIPRKIALRGIPFSFVPENHLGIALYNAFQRKTAERDNDSSFSAPLAEPQAPPLSRAWKGEAKYNLVEQCYQAYQQALARYQPRPFRLQTLDIFYYHEATSLDYVGVYPVLPERLLRQERYEELLPSLAQHLYWYHLREKSTSFPRYTPDVGPARRLLLLTGNFVWLPADYSSRFIDAAAQQLATHLTTSVLEADRFAFWLGQGPALERQLRLLQKEREEQQLKEHRTPTLAERIGHLEALNEQERQTVRCLLEKIQKL